MKKIVLIFIGLFSISTSFSQILLSEDFNYPTGVAGDSIGGGPGTTTALGDTIWKKHSGTATGARCVKYTTSSLNYTGYAGSGIGGAATFQHTVGSADINGSIGTSINSGSVYTSFLLKVDSTGGNDTTCDYFFNYCDLFGAVAATNFRAKTFICAGTDSATKFKIGINKGLNAKPTAAQITAGGKYATFSPEYDLHQTYLVVIKYTFNAATGDDVVDLFVFPAGALPNVEPTPTITSIDGTSSDLTKIQSICIRQGSIGKTFGTIDGIRVFTTWDAATIALLPNNKLNSFNAIGLKDVVNVNWNLYCGESGSKFVVERSVDGINFNELPTSYTTSSKINCSLSYSFADKNLPNSTALYYRLKMIATNGNVEYSAIQKIKLSNIKLSISPNPTANDILVNATKNITNVEVYNVDGKKVYSLNNNATTFVKIATTTFANGTYIVKTVVDGETNSNTVIVKH